MANQRDAGSWLIHASSSDRRHLGCTDNRTGDGTLPAETRPLKVRRLTFNILAASSLVSSSGVAVIFVAPHYLSSPSDSPAQHAASFGESFDQKGNGLPDRSDGRCGMLRDVAGSCGILPCYGSDFCLNSGRFRPQFSASLRVRRTGPPRLPVSH